MALAERANHGQTRHGETVRSTRAGRQGGMGGSGRTSGQQHSRYFNAGNVQPSLTNGGANTTRSTEGGSRQVGSPRGTRGNHRGEGEIKPSNDLWRHWR